MKMAVIMATFHMSMGIICKGLNAIFFKKWKILFFEVFTGLMVFWGLIGWLVFLIFFKWMGYPVNPYASQLVDDEKDDFAKLNMAPSLINTMTSLCLGFMQGTYSPQSVNPFTRKEETVKMFGA